jgi:CheY-like chemotaxis protein/HPt (histidine-containing phosphotransfer) domain-containing protein
MPEAPEQLRARDIESRLAPLRLTYLAALRERARLVEAALRACERGELGSELRASLRMTAHKLAGTGATYGFEALSHAARALDDRLKEAPDASPATLDVLIARLLVACRSALGLDVIINSPVRSPTRSRTFGRRGLSQDTLAPQTRRPRLLVVDDDPAIRDLFASTLGAMAEVQTAINTDEALRSMRLRRPDLILLDDIMPGGVTGLKFLEWIARSEQFRQAPVIMITASDEPEHVSRGIAAGALAYITKPFDAVSVIDQIQNHLIDIVRRR